MKRYVLAPRAEDDLDDILSYLDGLPIDPTNRIGREIQFMLRSVSTDPLQGYLHTDFSSLYGDAIHSRIAAGYRIFYVATGSPRLILGILHTKRDIATIMRQRLV